MPQLTEAELRAIRSMDMKEVAFRQTLAGFLARHLVEGCGVAGVTPGQVADGLERFVLWMPLIFDQAAEAFSRFVTQFEEERDP